jgi:hemoglobin
MKKDIKNRKDIEQLVNVFYQKVRNDKSIGRFFTELPPAHWEKHINIMYNFWGNILFFTGEYDGNPMNLHRHLSKINNIEKRHFIRWNKLFTDTVDELFEGEKTTYLKMRALNISAILQKNIFTNKNIQTK